MERIYMDNAATTRVKPEVLEAMLPFYGDVYGNPSTIYSFGREAKAALERARQQVATAIGADKDEIYFTSCGTESDNWAIKGTAFAHAAKGNHIITSAIEHHAVLHTCQWLEKHGFTVTYLPVDEFGFVRPQDVEAAMTDKTILVTVMFANNEIGTIEPVEEIARIAHAHGALFNTDAVQAVGAVPIDVHKMGFDMLSLSGHKLYAPKGVGALYIKKGVRVDINQQGGAQERGKRGGTENMAQIVGLGKAIAMATEDVEGHPGCQAQRPPHAAPAQQRQRFHPLYRRGSNAFAAGPGGHCRLKRFRLHVRIARPQPRALGDWPAARGCARVVALDVGRFQHRARRGHRVGKTAGYCRKTARNVAAF